MICAPTKWQCFKEAAKGVAALALVAVILATGCYLLGAAIDAEQPTPEEMAHRALVLEGRQ